MLKNYAGAEVHIKVADLINDEGREMVEKPQRDP